MNYTTRKTCRICGSSDLTFLFSLGNQYVSDFPKPNELLPEPVPIDLELCNNCMLVQAKHTAPQEFLYSRFYWYRSGVTRTMREALRDVASSIENLVSFQPKDAVLDIGSNDGTLLRAYTNKTITRVGVEPATNLAKEGAAGIDYFINDFWEFEKYIDILRRKVRVITALGMFYDLEDPNQFIADIAKALSNGGLFVAQLMCLKNMLDLGDVGNFAHEHLEFYSFKSLVYLFAKHGLKIIDIETNNVNGQSYRIYACHQRDTVSTHPGAVERLEVVWAAEKGLDDPHCYQQFFEKLEANKRSVVNYIRGVIDAGKSVWVYGASTKGNVILQYYGLDSEVIVGAAERSPEKYGRVTVGTDIPIYSEEEARRREPDYFLVLPYTFIDEFVEREQAFLSRGGHFIVPLPEMRVI